MSRKSKSNISDLLSLMDFTVSFVLLANKLKVLFCPVVGGMLSTEAELLPHMD